MRGPGETQLETDRRVIRRKISVLKRRLRDVAGHRANQRQGRGGRDVPAAALIGYTNAGKSSILRALSGAVRLDTPVGDKRVVLRGRGDVPLKKLLP